MKQEQYPNRRNDLKKSYHITKHVYVNDSRLNKLFQFPITILICILIGLGFLIIKLLNLNPYFDSNTEYKLTMKNLQINNHSPLLEDNSMMIKNPNSFTNCQIKERQIESIKTFQTPKSHPLPAVGLKDLFDQNQCSTYKDRYYPYEDEVLGTTYLQNYPPLTLPSKTNWEEIEKFENLLSQTMRDKNVNTDSSYLDWKDVINGCYKDEQKSKRALVIRTHENYTWGKDDILNIRALITELTLKPKPQDRYDVHLLLEIIQPNSSFILSEKQRLKILENSIPKEFWSLTTFWNEDEMTFLYPGLNGKIFHNMKLTNSYRSCFMPLQVFSKRHPEYEYLWNWEMDTRSTQDYSVILENIERFAANAPLDKFLDNQSSWYIPASSSQDLASNPLSTSPQEADLITLNPIFNTNESGFYWSYDYQNFPKDTKRKASIGKNVRFSKRLLDEMNEANVEEKISAHCENFASTILVKKSIESQNQQWKGVYVPLPIFTRHNWSSSSSNKVLNDAINRKDVYKRVNEMVLREFSFYYDGYHAKDIYDNWRENSRVCRTPALLHPITRQP